MTTGLKMKMRTWVWCIKGFNTKIKTCCLLDIDGPLSSKCCKPDVERILEFGKELYSMSRHLNVDQITNVKNQKMLEVSTKGFLSAIFIFL